MLANLFTSPLFFFYTVIALLLAITVHEFSHALIADRLGDPTARLGGRLTLNPLAHLDPIGTIALLLIGFGWGKPVPFDPYNLSKPKRDGALISLAGPVSNMVLAIFCSLILHLLTWGTTASLFAPLLETIIYFNIVLAVFNLLPIHPLDGFKIVSGILPADKSRQWDELASYGMFFLLILLLPLQGRSMVSNILQPPIRFLLSILLP